MSRRSANFMLRKIIFKYLPPVVWAIVIFILSSIPGNDYPPVFFDYSYLAHLVEFFILALLILRALGVKEKNIYLILILGALYALLDEVHQTFVTERSISLMDWLIDFLGVVLGTKFGILYLKRGIFYGRKNESHS